jgi:hypothetical protein
VGTSLQPLKLAVEALCQRDSSLITADTTLKFVLNKLKSRDTVWSADLSEKLCKRIGERHRIEVTGILIYLQNPKKYDSDVKNTNHTFTMPKKKNVMRQAMKNMVNHVNICI